MCWITENKPKMCVAEQDIPIVKIVDYFDRKYHAHYYDKEYIPNKVACDDCDLSELIYRPDKEIYCKEEAIHSYSSNVKIEFGETEHGQMEAFIYFGGICISNMRTVLQYTVIVNGFIPKHSPYYVNEQGEYISSRIVLTNIREYVLD